MRRHVWLWLPVPVIAAAGLLLLTTAGGGSQQPPAISPTATVSGFLRTALVARDPVGACEYLMPAQRRRLGGEARCRADVARLPRRRELPAYTLTARGTRVAVTDGRTRIVLRLDRLRPFPEPVASAPPGVWRIAAGAEQVLRPAGRPT